MRARTSRGGRARCASRISSARCGPPACAARGLRNLRVLSRNTSDRVARFASRASRRPRSAATSSAWRSAASPAGNRSRAPPSISIAPSSGYRFKGRGFGHGVGLCVIGAGRRAAKGATANDILKFYFPGSDGWIRSAPTTITTAAAAPAPRSRAAAATDVALALPGAEESERAVRDVADPAQPRRDRESHRRDGSGAPARSPCIHRSRASAAPPASRGGSPAPPTAPAIDLLPITILRQQGQLDRTIRHEVTHALLDGALAKRPMWVREGAAAYFARADGSRPTSRTASIVRATPSCCARSPPARNAMPTPAPKRASRAASPTANAGIKFAKLGSGAENSRSAKLGSRSPFG